MEISEELLRAIKRLLKDAVSPTFPHDYAKIRNGILGKIDEILPVRDDSKQIGHKCEICGEMIYTHRSGKKSGCDHKSTDSLWIDAWTDYADARGILMTQEERDSCDNFAGHASPIDVEDL